jgi:hypothetical protein
LSAFLSDAIRCCKFLRCFSDGISALLPLLGHKSIAIESSKVELSETYKHHGADQAATRPESSESVLVDHHEEIVMPSLAKKGASQVQEDQMKQRPREEKNSGRLDQSEPKERLETRFWSSSQAYAHGQ